MTTKETEKKELTCAFCNHTGTDVAMYHIGGKGELPCCVDKCQDYQPSGYHEDTLGKTIGRGRY